MARRVKLLTGHRIPLVTIVGPTASGKSQLAVDLAEQYGGEIICADSRTVYKGMDIGTAKPSREERTRVAHWGLDLVGPGQKMTAALFQEYAYGAIEDIRRRGKIPFLVGGSGLYIDSILFDYTFNRSLDGARSAEDRKTYGVKKSSAVYTKHSTVDGQIIPDNSFIQSKVTTLGDIIVVGIATNRQVLRQRIVHRIEHMLHNGVVEESICLGSLYGWSHSAMTGNIYELLRGITMEDQRQISEVTQKAVIKDWGLAKRQMTWFQRNPYIAWGTPKDAREYISCMIDHRYDTIV